MDKLNIQLRKYKVRSAEELKKIFEYLDQTYTITHGELIYPSSYPCVMCVAIHDTGNAVAVTQIPVYLKDFTTDIELDETEILTKQP